MNFLKDVKTFINTEYFTIKNEIMQKSNEMTKKNEALKHLNGNLPNNPNGILPIAASTLDNEEKSKIHAEDKHVVGLKKGVELKFLLDESHYIDRLHLKSNIKVNCTPEKCMGSILHTTKLLKCKNKKSKEEIIEQATDFINQFYASVKRDGSKYHKERLDEIVASINKSGTYELKETELSFGARTAWRNAPRCIGRIQWSKLQLFDSRCVINARGMFEAICNHIKYAYNDGIIRSAITIFRQRTDPEKDFRVWNGQFFSYAGYKIDEKTFKGDKSQIEFTNFCIKLGWTPKYTDFDLLPLVLQANGQDPEWFEIPDELVHEVEITHPKLPWFKDLKLKWYCVPAVASMRLDVGGLEFTACPFNGWYMCTEISRDLSDINRYNKLPLIAEKMGLDIKNVYSLWKDKALVELTYAILSSFQKNNITITDHHSAAESFMKHYENENHLRGGCPADWVWVVPPLSSHLTPVFHLEMLNYILKPSYEYQDIPWKNYVWKLSTNENATIKPKRTFREIARAVKFSTKLMSKALSKRIKCTILYATETGKSERYAKTLVEIFKNTFDPKLFCMDDYDVANLEHETLLLIVTSTFGNGDPPENGKEFKNYLYQSRKEQDLRNKTEFNTANKSVFKQSSIFIDSLGTLNNVRFSVFGLGNSSYPNFCSFGNFLDGTLDYLGGERIYELGVGDELNGQEESFRGWSIEVYKSALKAFCIDMNNSTIADLTKDDSLWSPLNYRLVVDESNELLDTCINLSKLHNRKVLPCKYQKKRNLIENVQDRKTLCIDLNIQEYIYEFEYNPGDHIGIFAENRKDLIDKILQKLSDAPDPDQPIKIEVLKEKSTVFGNTKQWSLDEKFPITTLRDAFKYYLDITTPLTQNMLLYLSTQASDENDKINLEKLANEKDCYENWKLNGYPNLAEVLEEFPSVMPNASLLLTQLPKLQPRFYSISSSPKVSNETINITLGVVEYTPNGKSTHYGVCSKWLDDLQVNAQVPAFIRKAPSFYMPEDIMTPIIMVGAGTGIAPFRSFWQERLMQMKQANHSNFGEFYLYFGCRHTNIDELYKKEIEQLTKDKVITGYYAAYSREHLKKVYVQDMLAKNMQQISDLLFNKNGHFYVCGEVQMAADVTQMIELILQIHNNMSAQESKQYILQMKEDLRFHEDIFGNSLKKYINQNDT